MATGFDPDIRYCSQCGQPSRVEELARFGDALVCPNCKGSFVQKLREGVSPVSSTFQYAGFWIRFLAILIDGIILAVVGGVIQFMFMGGSIASMGRLGRDVPPDQAFAALAPMLGLIGLAWLISIAIGCSYEALFVSRFGATPGKMVCSLKVVRPDGGPISLGRGVARYFGKMLSYMAFMIGFIIAGFDEQKRAMHDYICDTRVIKAGEFTSPAIVPQV